MTEVEIRECAPSEPACRRLLERLDAGLSALYPPEEYDPITLRELLEPHVTFVAARHGGEVVGCGALVRRGSEYAEVKRLYVDPAVRGLGIGKQIMRALEDRGAAEGYRILRAETGTRQPEALALYRRFGYRRIGPFGGYPDCPTTVFLEKRLDPER
ncbi:MAG TPA: GNAT family N-acetyltransferase [Burkholderiales bacterium]|nr:GNAT family N-acetyltransferase [Burkholderiales bacterium]